jgi:hypothetical protein
VATQRDTSFDDSNFSDNSNGSLPSADRDGWHISKQKDAQLAHHYNLIINSALPALEIKISITQKAQIRDSIFDPKN